ncbi:hypothetical protein [Bacillus methanolicus]|uniref:hypothetical protein n=1 Tax=Bacillus methanolicus TaxID=1471 RepID=UPI0023808F01|nr:hypothetical protein [Bacillus methanolicus]
MNLLKVGMSGMLIGGLLAGCEISESLKTSELKEEVNTETKKSEEVDPKESKDLSTTKGIENPDIEPDVKKWIAKKVEEFSKPHPKVSQAGFDEGYDYYLKAQSVSNEVGSYIRVEGVDLEKDFENLRQLSSIISHEQFVRTAHIDPNGNAKEKTEYAKEWKPVNERMKRTFEYMKELLNDINVAINKNGKGETFGVSHQLDGDKVSEMESFMEYFEEGNE